MTAETTNTTEDVPETKEYTMNEVATNTSKESCWLVIKDMNDGDTPKVYDVSSYLDDHPGGAEVMLELAGQDATNMFEDIGHSSDARIEMKKFLVGKLKLTEEEKENIALAAAKSWSGLAGKRGLNLSQSYLLLLMISLGYYYSTRES
ncbi:unnamed protein product [Ascophyllum nodosum]